MPAKRWWTSAGLEFAYFSGLSRLAELSGRGNGAILRFERVRPARRDRFQPLLAREITPQFLDRLLRALQRWNCEVVPLDAVVAPSARPGRSPRFVCLTFDGGSCDVATWAYPILARHRVPFTVFLPTAFPDGLGEAWWLALEQVIASTDRIGLMIDHNERRFDTATVADKTRVFHFLASWLSALAPAELTAAIHDLCRRYAVDLAKVTREAVLSWEEVARLAADPNVRIGSATVSYPRLANLADAAAQREIAMGRAVLQSALGRDAPYFAYPFGERGSFTERDVKLVAEAGVVAAVTAIPGVIRRDRPPDPLRLPRIAWDGERGSLRGLRVLLSGLLPDAASRVGRVR